MTACVMIQGVGSNVGKSLLVTGLCRYFARQGLKVRPFKPQNMSNNASVTAEGGEIGRAQALQALACYCAPSNDMNPVLLKPQTETGAQVIVNGQVFGTMQAKEYGTRKHELLPHVMAAFNRLCEGADLVIVEGAGSPAEINLRQGDIANMGFAEAADIPVIIIGDIDRGGVMASLIGTKTILAEEDAARIKGVLVNKFRGDTSLFKEGMAIISKVTGWTNLGILPWFEGAGRLAAEDILDLANKVDNQDNNGAGDRSVLVCVPVLKRIANFDDLDPLFADPHIELRLIAAGVVIPAETDLIILPGSKTSIADMHYLEEQGWDIDIKAHWRRGGHILGLCGGYQMLGRTLSDPDGIEGEAGTINGLGLLNIDTILAGDKTTMAASGIAANGAQTLSGYEIHMGRTTGPDCARPLIHISDKGEMRPDGAISADGRVFGTYLHGLFGNDDWRRDFFMQMGCLVSDMNFEAVIEKDIDDLADHLEGNMNMAAFAEIVGQTK